MQSTPAEAPAAKVLQDDNFKKAAEMLNCPLEGAAVYGLSRHQIVM